MSKPPSTLPISIPPLPEEGRGWERGSGGEESPYPGPCAFTDADRDRFFGREREIRQLLDLAVARRVVLVYAPSGAGKTSLLQAGLLPRLRALRGVTVLPVARVGGAPPPGTDPAAVRNVYVLSVLLYLFEGVSKGREPLTPWPPLPSPPARPGEGEIREGGRGRPSPGWGEGMGEGMGVRGSDGDLTGLAGLRLAEGLDRLLASSEEEEPRPTFLVLDQLEELFTAHPERWPDRAGFFEQLEEALARHSEVTLILAMREEYLAQLDPFRTRFPDHLRTRFRLDLPGPDAAREAIEKPAGAFGVRWSPEAVTALVDDLRAFRVPGPNGTTVERPGPYVEPVQLQVVCRRIWERRAFGTEGGTEIGLSQVTAQGDVEQALAGYYAGAVQRAAAAGGVPERAVRDWVESRLLTSAGLRGQAPLETGLDGGIARAVEALVQAHVLRVEERRGVDWIELAHDRLVAPVLRDNAAWRDRHLTTFERQAALWDRQGRPPGLILAGPALAQAEAEIARRREEPTPAEREFLEACRRERRSALRLRLYAAAITLFALLAVTAGGVALHFKGTAQEQGEHAVTEGIRARAISLADDRLDEALLLALAAGRREEGPASRRLLHQILEASPRLEALLHGHRDEVLAVAWSPDGRRLASGSRDGTVRLWDAATGEPAGLPLAGHRGAVWSVAFSPRGDLLATAGEDGTLLLWDLSLAPPGPRRVAATGGETAFHAVRFSPDGTRLAAAASDGTVRRWAVAGGSPIGEPLDGPDDWIDALAWSPDGRILAAGSMDKKVWLWDADTGAGGRPLTGHTEGVTDLAFTPDGRTLASAGLDGAVFLWDPETGAPFGPALAGLTDAVQSLAVSPRGDLLAAGGVDGRIVLWDLVHRRPAAPPFTGQAVRLHGLAWSPDGRRLAAGHGSAVSLWRVDGGPRLGRAVTLPLDEVTRVTADAAGNHLLVAGRDRDRRLPAIRWLDAAGRPLAPPLPWPSTARRVTALGFGEEGTAWAAALDGTVRRWRLRDGSPLPVPPGWPVSGWRLLAAAGGRRALAFVTEDGAARLLDASTGRPSGPVFRAGTGIAALALAPDGHTLALASQDGGILLADALTGRRLATLTPGLEPVVHLAWSPDGQTLALSDRRRVLLQDAASGEVLAGPLTGHKDDIADLAFLAGGKTLVSVDNGGTALRWDVDPASWRSRACAIARHSLTPDEWRELIPGAPYESLCGDPRSPGLEPTKTIPIRRRPSSRHPERALATEGSSGRKPPPPRSFGR